MEERKLVVSHACSILFIYRYSFAFVLIFFSVAIVKILSIFLSLSYSCSISFCFKSYKPNLLCSWELHLRFWVSRGMSIPRVWKNIWVSLVNWKIVLLWRLAPAFHFFLLSLAISFSCLVHDFLPWYWICWVLLLRSLCLINPFQSSSVSTLSLERNGNMFIHGATATH